MGTKRRDAADPPRPLRDKESNRQVTDPHLDENNLLWENQTTPLRGAPPRPAAPFDAGSSRKYYLLRSTQRQVPLLRRGLERGRVLQEEPIYFRLREVQLLQGIHCRLPV